MQYKSLCRELVNCGEVNSFENVSSGHSTNSTKKDTNINVCVSQSQNVSPHYIQQPYVQTDWVRQIRQWLQTLHIATICLLFLLESLKSSNVGSNSLQRIKYWYWSHPTSALHQSNLATNFPIRKALCGKTFCYLT